MSNLPQRLAGGNAEVRNPQRQVDEDDPRSAEDDEQNREDQIAAERGHGLLPLHKKNTIAAHEGYNHWLPLDAALFLQQTAEPGMVRQSQVRPQGLPMAGVAEERECPQVPGTGRRKRAGHNSGHLC